MPTLLTQTSPRAYLEVQDPDDATKYVELAYLQSYDWAQPEATPTTRSTFRLTSSTTAAADPPTLSCSFFSVPQNSIYQYLRTKQNDRGVVKFRQTLTEEARGAPASGVTCAIATTGIATFAGITDVTKDSDLGIGVGIKYTAGAQSGKVYTIRNFIPASGSDPTLKTPEMTVRMDQKPSAAVAAGAFTYVSPGWTLLFDARVTSIIDLSQGDEVSEGTLSLVLTQAVVSPSITNVGS